MNHPSEILKDIILKILSDQKSLNVLDINLIGKNDITDFIIIATGSSGRHILTIKEKIISEIKSTGYKILGVEGENTGNWIIIDLEDVIVHLFREEVRDYYNIEKIWISE